MQGLRSDEVGKRTTLLLVGGTARSGSTVLDLMLGNRDGAVSCGEVSNVFRPSREEHLAARCRCGNTDCTAWIPLLRLSRRSFHHSMLTQTGADCIVDSSKGLSWILDSARSARRHGLDPVLVLPWKTPEQLARSFFRRDTESGIELALSEFTNYYAMALSLGLDSVSVRNDDLRTRPEDAVARLCTTVGVPYESGQERFWEREQHYFFGSESATDQVRAGAEIGDATVDDWFRDAWQATSLDETTRAVQAALESLDVFSICAPRPGAPVPGARRFTAHRYAHQRVVYASRAFKLHAQRASKRFGMSGR